MTSFVSIITVNFIEKTEEKFGIGHNFKISYQEFLFL